MSEREQSPRRDVMVGSIATIGQANAARGYTAADEKVRVVRAQMKADAELAIQQIIDRTTGDPLTWGEKDLCALSELSVWAEE